MTTEQTSLTDDAHEIRLKAPVKAKLLFLSDYIISHLYKYLCIQETKWITFRNSMSCSIF